MKKAIKKTATRFFATPEEYFFWETQATHKHEYRSGEVIAMSGGTITHNTISGNVFAYLHQALRGKTCKPYNSDMKLAISQHNSFVYPDVMVICGKAQLWQDRQDTLANPVLIVEVLSESTANYDRGEKFLKYQSIDTVAAYLLIDSLSIRAELFTRTEALTWKLQIFELLTDSIPLNCLSIDILMSEVYEGVLL